MLREDAPDRKRLRICFIQEPLHAGVGRHTVDVARTLADRGHEIHILYSPVRLEPQFLADLSGHPGIFCHAIRMYPGLCAGDVAAFRRVKNYVKGNGPFDVIHGMSSKGGGFARLLKLFGAKTVLYSPHAFITLSPFQSSAKCRFFAGIELLLSHFTDMIVCSSQSEREHGLSLGIAPKKLAVVVNGRSPASVPDRQSLRTGLGFCDQVVIGFAGRLEAQKAPHRLVEAAIKLLPANPQLHLLMIGDGPERLRLEEMMQAARLTDRATWLGAVDAVQFMPAMDILAMPSAYEGFAYVLLEALHAGLPIVATPVGGTAESVVPGKNGIIVPHQPVEPLVAALRQLTLDVALRERMAATARERASLFSVARMVDGLENLYRGICDAKAGQTTSGRSVASLGSEPYFETRRGL